MLKCLPKEKEVSKNMNSYLMLFIYMIEIISMGIVGNE